MEVGLVYDAFISAQYIDVKDPRVAQGIDLYVSKGLLEPDRKEVLLAPELIPPPEAAQPAAFLIPARRARAFLRLKERYGANIQRCVSSCFARRGDPDSIAARGGVHCEGCIMIKDYKNEMALEITPAPPGKPNVT